MERIQVEQALFGYSDGHTLVAASVALPSRVQRDLGRLTDLSGPTRVDGFGCSCTGVPLKGSDYYALFRTWLAPEMSRPGCVWSHVLLIRLADLARVADMGVLRSLFMRPSESFELYGRSAAVDTTRVPHECPLSRPLATAIMQGLYDQPGAPVFVGAWDGESLEEAVFCIWSQQWPRLRRSFSFSSGSLSDRSALGFPFDLQVVPVSLLRQLGDSTAVVIDSTSPAASDEVLRHGSSGSWVDSKSQGWLQVAVDDLVDRVHPDLRAYFREFGVDVMRPRASYSHLAKAYVETSRSRPRPESLQQVAAAFPDPEDAITLKRAVLSSVSEDQIVAVLRFLLTDPAAAAFIETPVVLSARTQVLWQDDREALLALLSDARACEVSPLYGGVVSSLASDLVPSELPQIWAESPALLGDLVRANVDLLCDSAAWRLPKAGQRALLESVSADSTLYVPWLDLMTAALGAGANSVAGALVARAGDQALSTVVLWMESSEGSMPRPSKRWRKALSPLASDVPHDATAATLALRTWLMTTSEARHAARNMQHVEVLSARPLAELPPALRTPTAFFLSTAALLGRGQMACDALRRGAFPTHQALGFNDYPSESWALLEPVLPEVSWWRAWDRCERFNRAVRKWVKRNPDPSEGLHVKAESDDERIYLRSLA